MMTYVVIVFVGVLLYDYRVSKKLILESTFENVKNMAGLTLNRIDTVLIAVTKVSKSMATFIEFSTLTETELLSILRSIVETNPTICGRTI